MNGLLVLAAENGTSGVLLLRYAVYAAIIVIGILILALLKRLTRLPKHGELKNKIAALAAELDSPRQNAYDRMKATAKQIYQLDKLIYASYSLAQKERDGDLDNLSVMLESARNELAAYKSVRCEGDRLSAARAKIGDGIALLDKVIEREEHLKKKEKK